MTTASSPTRFAQLSDLAATIRRQVGCSPTATVHVALFEPDPERWHDLAAAPGWTRHTVPDPAGRIELAVCHPDHWAEVALFRPRCLVTGAGLVAGPAAAAGVPSLRTALADWWAVHVRHQDARFIRSRRLARNAQRARRQAVRALAAQAAAEARLAAATKTV